VETYNQRKLEKDINIERANLCLLSAVVPSLEEDKTYYFEVLAVSHNDYEAKSSQYVLHIPGYRQIRAIAVGVAVGFAFLLVAAGGTWYMRRLYIKRLRHAEKDEVY
jgi:hypothetical protein